MWFWGRSIFPSLPMSSLELLQLNHDHYIFSLFIWPIKTKFNLFPPTIEVFIKFKFDFLPSWHITNTPACASHPPCEFQRRWPSQWHAPHLLHIVWNLHKNQMSHIRMLHASPSSLPFANRTLMSLPAPCVGQPPILLRILGLWRSVLPLCQTMRHFFHWFWPWGTNDLALA